MKQKVMKLKALSVNNAQVLCPHIYACYLWTKLWRCFWTTPKYHKSRFTYRSSPVVPSPSFRAVVIFVLLILPVLACGVINPQYQTNNEVRLAVYKYEQEVHGKVDDLVIDFRRDEPRIKFEGQNEDGGRTVWLYHLGAQEFFALRPPEKTYLYMQGIEYNDNHSIATITIYRGDGTGYKGRILTVLRNDKHHWSVSSETEIKKDASN